MKISDWTIYAIAASTAVAATSGAGIPVCAGLIALSGFATALPIGSVGITQNPVINNTIKNTQHITNQASVNATRSSTSRTIDKCFDSKNNNVLNFQMLTTQLNITEPHIFKYLTQNCDKPKVIGRFVRHFGKLSPSGRNTLDNLLKFYRKLREPKYNAINPLNNIKNRLEQKKQSNWITLDSLDRSSIEVIEMTNALLEISKIVPKKFAAAAKQVGYTSTDVIDLCKESIDFVNNRRKQVEMQYKKCLDSKNGEYNFEILANQHNVTEPYIMQHLIYNCDRAGFMQFFSKNFNNLSTNGRNNLNDLLNFYTNHQSSGLDHLNPLNGAPYYLNERKQVKWNTLDSLDRESIMKIEIINDFLLISEIAPKEFALAAKEEGYEKGDFIELLKSSIAPVNHQCKQINQKNLLHKQSYSDAHTSNGFNIVSTEISASVNPIDSYVSSESHPITKQDLKEINATNTSDKNSKCTESQGKDAVAFIMIIFGFATGIIFGYFAKPHIDSLKNTFCPDLDLCKIKCTSVNTELIDLDGLPEDLAQRIINNQHNQPQITSI